MNTIDSYLKHQMENGGTTFHFLLMVDSDFDPSKIPGLTISGKLGRIWSASGTKETIEALKTAEGVIGVEASR